MALHSRGREARGLPHPAPSPPQELQSGSVVTISGVVAQVLERAAQLRRDTFNGGTREGLEPNRKILSDAQKVAMPA